MKILFISHSSEIGGAENFLYTLLKSLPKEQFECYCLFPRTGPLEKRISALGIKTYISELKWWVSSNKNTIVTLFNFCHDLKKRIDRIIEIILSNNIDLVVTNTIVIGEGAIAAKITNVPHLWYILEILSSDPGLHAFTSLDSFYSLIILLSDYIVTVSNAVKKEIEDHIKYISPKIKTIYGGIEIKKEVSQSQFMDTHKNKIVFSAGNICRRKGLTTLLKAAKYVHEVIPDVKFKIAGRIVDEDYYKKILKERKQLKLEKAFESIGFCNNIYPFLESSSIFVLSSLSEPFGLVILEAMNSSKPVIATNSGGSAEAVIDGKTGFIVPVDDAKTMAEKIIYLLKNDDIAYQMGKAGYERLKNDFNNKRFADGLINCFQITLTESVTKKRSILEIEKALEILSGIGILSEKMKEYLYYYEQINNSLIFKIYKKLGLLKYPIRKFFILK